MKMAAGCRKDCTYIFLYMYHTSNIHSAFLMSITVQYKNPSNAFGGLPSIRNSLYVVCLVQVSKVFRSSYDQISEINCLSLYHVSKPIGPSKKNTRFHKHVSTSYQFCCVVVEVPGSMIWSGQNIWQTCTQTMDKNQRVSPQPSAIPNSE